MELSYLARKLLEWYKEKGRNLPFRNEHDAYKIWISEIMSQQTRIEAMLNHYKAFIETYPDMKALAESDEESLLKHWQGLGYYNRAKNLRKAAQICVEQFAGKLPHSKKELISLPGIGDYTASAIRSFAYGEREVALDGNGIRVFSRLMASDSDYSQKKNKESLKEKILSFMPAEQSADFNQAVMDLANSICLPKAPKCYECPLAGECIAFRLGDPSIYPMKRKKKERVEERLSFYAPLYFEAVKDKENNQTIQVWTYLEKREEKDVLQGLYGFKQALPQGLSYINILQERDIARYWHFFTHKAWFIQGKLIIVDAKTDQFITLEEAEKLPLPSAFQPFWKALKAVAESEKASREAKLQEEPDSVQESRDKNTACISIASLPSKESLEKSSLIFAAKEKSSSKLEEPEEKNSESQKPEQNSEKEGQAL